MCHFVCSRIETVVDTSFSLYYHTVSSDRLRRLLQIITLCVPVGLSPQKDNTILERVKIPANLHAIQFGSGGIIKEDTIIPMPHPF